MSQSLHVNALESEPIGKLLWSYSIPAIIGMALVSLYNVVDSIFIGHGVGAVAIAGLGVAAPFMNLTMAICMLVGIGGATISSIELGRKNVDRAFQVLGHVVILSIGMGCCFGFGCLPILRPLLILFGASEVIMPYAYDFMQIVLIFAPVFFVMLALNNVMRSTGYPKKAMQTSMISVAVNVVLAAIFIFWLELGIRGAALATVCGQIVALTWILHHFFNKNSVLHFRRGIFTLRKDIVLSMLKIGLAPFMVNVCGSVVVVFFNLRLFSYGGDMGIGAFGIVNRLLLLFGMIAVGLTQGMQPIIGFNFGAKRMDRVKTVLRYGIIAATLITFIGWLIMQLIPEALAMMFTNDANLLLISVEAMRYCSLFFFLAGSQIVFVTFFQSLGMPSIAILLSLCRQMLLLLPALVVLPLFLGLKGVWLSLPFADAMAFLVSSGVWVWASRRHLEGYQS